MAQSGFFKIREPWLPPLPPSWEAIVSLRVFSLPEVEEVTAFELLYGVNQAQLALSD